MHSCSDCGKDFPFVSKLLRHRNRVTSCSPNKVSVENENNVEKVKEKEKNVNNSEENVNTTEKNVNNSEENVNPSEKNVNKHQDKEFQCNKCDKVLSSKFALNRHSKICKGVHVLQCPTCLKTFSDRSSKSHHIKKVQCKPPEESLEPHKNSVYLLIEREFMTTKKNIFKIGRSVKVSNRTRQYPKGSQLLVVLPCIDSVVTETHLKRVFSEKFIQRSDIGLEYYEGSPNTVIKEFVDNVTLHF